LATTDQRYNQDRRDNGAIASGEPFYKRSPKNAPPRLISTSQTYNCLCTYRRQARS